MKKIRQVFMKWKTELIAAGLLLLLSLAMIFAGFRFYRQYRAQVIETEESQLLTMAGIIGNNLNMYLEQQLDQIICFMRRRQKRAVRRRQRALRQEHRIS